MSVARKAFLGVDIFDGYRVRSGNALVVEAERVVGIVPAAELYPDLETETLSGGVLCPGFVDLQVNGGGGRMFNDDPSVETLVCMAEAHTALGATSILPTLITDTAERTRAAIAAVREATDRDVPGVIGLHLEGPHLALSRKGAHDGSLVRPMSGADLRLLTEAARELPILMVTLAPDVVPVDQIAALCDAGAIVSIGHSDASFIQCRQAMDAGAVCATHLFNAMRQLGSREPGVVGAALGLGGLSTGLIADGIHVHPETAKLAIGAKQGPGQVFLVSDAMGVAGTDEASFVLNGRRVFRRDGSLTLEDGTLAGADLNLPDAVRNIVRWGAADVETALVMASRIPAELAGAKGGIGTLASGAPADFLLLDLDGRGPPAVWKSGRRLPSA